MSRRNKPSSGQNETPTYLKRDEHGTPIAEVWLKSSSARPPERYHESHPHGPGLTKYIRWLVPIAGIFLCAWLGPLLKQFAEMIA